MGRAALGVDVEAVGADADRRDLGAQLVEHLWRNLVGGPVGAIDDHLQAVEVQEARKAGLGDLDVAGLGVIDPAHAAEVAGGHQTLLQALVHMGLDLQLADVAELVAVRAEQLDAVVGKGIVRGADHHAQVRAHGAGHHGHGGRRQRAEQPHVHAHAGEAGDQRRFDHVARQAGVLADDHQGPAAMITAEQLSGGQAHAQRDLGGHRVAVGLPANAVGAEIGPLAHERLPAPKKHATVCNAVLCRLNLGR